MPTPTAYLSALEEPRRSEVKALHTLIRTHAPQWKPWLHGEGAQGIIGYGKFPYETKSGCQGDWFPLGLSSRKQYISLYACAIKDGQYVADAYRQALPKADIGKSCIRFKELKDVDQKVLVKLIKEVVKLHKNGANEMFC